MRTIFIVSDVSTGKSLGAFTDRTLAVASLAETFSTSGGITSLPGDCFTGTGCKGRQSFVVSEIELHDTITHL